MGAVATKSLADLRHRRLQAAALAVVLFLACAAATLALTILDASRQPFERAFAAANGAHLVLDYDGTLSAAAIAATAERPGVTAAAGPWPVTHAGFDHPKGGLVLGQPVSGRPAPDGSVDTPTISTGRWWAGPGEVVLGEDMASLLVKEVGATITVHPSPQAPAGDKGTVTAVPGPVASGPPAQPGSGADGAGQSVTLTVVGIASSISTPDVAAWMSPDSIGTLAGAAVPAEEMLYRVDPSASEADLAAAVLSVTHDLPSDAVVGRVSYLDTRTSVDKTADLYVPVLLAFSVFALLAAAFSIANLVSGIVLTGYRDIGVMKAVGFTPAQVTATLLAQVLVPVGIGAIGGIAVGTLASQPTVTSTARSFGVPATVVVSPGILALVFAIAIGITILAAVVPAIRAGRLDPVEAMTRGAMPATGGIGGRLRRLGLRLPVGLPVRLGITSGIAHPGRAAMTLGALVVGVVAVTFSLGMHLSLLRVMTQLDRNEAAPVRAELPGGARPAAGSAADITATIAAAPDTAHVVAIGQTDVSIPVAGTVPFVGYDGDASWVGYTVIHGRWFTGSGEAVAPTNFFRRTGLHVGDTVSVGRSGQTIQVRLVGEIFDIAPEARDDDLVLRGAWADVARLDPTAGPDRWEMQPRSGVSAHDYRSEVADATNRSMPVYAEGDSTNDAGFLLFLSVVATMGIVLVVISLGGVFNTVLLETRQRTRELAVLKAVGLTPRSTVAMIESSVLPVALLAGLIGVPLGLAIQRVVLAYMGETAARTAVPDISLDVFGPLALAVLAFTGLAIAGVGALLPAQRAARAAIAPVLQAE